jgi:hypothetical protein
MAKEDAMTTIYAVFLCTMIGGREICSPVPMPNVPEPTTEAQCEIYKHAAESSIDDPERYKVTCMKKTVPSSMVESPWEPVR